MEGTLLLWWGVTGSSDQRNCPLLPASQVLRHPEVSSEIQLLCCKRLLGAFLGPHGKHVTQVGNQHAGWSEQVGGLGSGGPEQNTTSVVGQPSVPGWPDAAPSQGKSWNPSELRETSGASGEVVQGRSTLFSGRS